MSKRKTVRPGDSRQNESQISFTPCRVSVSLQCIQLMAAYSQISAMLRDHLLVWE